MLENVIGFEPFAKAVLQSQIYLIYEGKLFSYFFTSYHATSYILPDIYDLIFCIYIVYHQLLELSNAIILEATLLKC